MIPLRDDNPTSARPFVTFAIIAACVVIYFFVQPTSGSNEDEEFLFERAAIPCEVTHGEPLSNRLAETECDGAIVVLGVPAAAPYFPGKNVLLALLTSMFLHGSILHLGGNMLYLWVYGNNVEDRLGHGGYAVFYLVSGLIASFAHVFTQPDSTTPVIGASGAIAGVMGAYLVFFPKARILTIIPLFIFIQFIHLPAAVVLLGWLALQFLTSSESGIAVMAHIGGFLAGAAIALVLRPFSRSGPPAGPPRDFRYEVD